MNKLKRILCAMLCVCMISIPMAIPTTVSAEDSISDLEQQLQQLEQENQKYQKILDDTKSDIAEKEEYKSALVSKVQVLDEKIAVTREKISSLNDDIRKSRTLMTRDFRKLRISLTHLQTDSEFSICQAMQPTLKSFSVQRIFLTLLIRWSL